MSLPTQTRRLPSAPAPASTEPPAWLAVATEKVRTMRYGVVQIVVHDGKVVQIERTERTRFDVPAEDRAG